MRALAEDARTGTLEVVLAQPVTELELVLGKYLGQLCFVWIALALTLTIPVGLSLGANLQGGIIVAQYVGAALLAAGLAAVGLWASSVTRNQITAFIVGVAVMFILILIGASPLLTGLPVGLSAIAASLSVLPHFENIARGVIDLRDAVYFVTLAALFLALAYPRAAGSGWAPPSWRRSSSCSTSSGGTSAGASTSRRARRTPCPAPPRSCWATSTTSSPSSCLSRRGFRPRSPS
jgi:ABC-2 type transport system permease protein